MDSLYIKLKKLVSLNFGCNENQRKKLRPSKKPDINTSFLPYGVKISEKLSRRMSCFGVRSKLRHWCSRIVRCAIATTTERESASRRWPHASRPLASRILRRLCDDRNLPQLSGNSWTKPQGICFVYILALITIEIN